MHVGIAYLRGGENVPGIPCACAPAILRIWQEAHYVNYQRNPNQAPEDARPCMMLNTLRPRQNGRHFPDDIFKCISLDVNVSVSLSISLKFVPKVRINNIPPLVQIMAWRRSGDKPLSEPVMVSILTHICVTRPQWVNQTEWKCRDGNRSVEIRPAYPKI